jgi:hypothetical protein
LTRSDPTQFLLLYQYRQKTPDLSGDEWQTASNLISITTSKSQDDEGMSWSTLGSKALAILKVTECNGQWRQTWFPQMAA